MSWLVSSGKRYCLMFFFFFFFFFFMLLKTCFYSRHDYKSSLLQQFSHFTIRCATSDWLRRGQNAHCIMGKCWQIKCHAIRNYTWVCFKWPKMWIKRLHAKIHNIITIYICYRTIYFKTITCIILIIVISNVYACKTHSVFNDFVDYCVTGKRNRTEVRAL